MSHLFAHLAASPGALPPTVPEPLASVETAHVRAAVSGIAETGFGGTLGQDGGWLVVGVGMRWDGDRRAWLDAADWADLLAGDLDALDELDGHFAALRWRGDRLDARTDALGGRSLYAARAPSGVVFSTRLDWLARFAGLSTVDWEAFGSHWLAANRFGPGTFVRGVERLAQGGCAEATPTSLRVTHRPWSPSAGDSPPPASLEDAVLRQLRTLPSDAISLGLSGGLDSRGLAAALVCAERPFVLHAFGPSEHPDVAMSERLAGRLGADHQRYAPHLPNDPDVLWQRLQAYAGETVAATPLTAGARLDAYPALHAHDLTVLDGGFGEIARRDYYKRLRLRARRAVRHRDASGIAPHVRADRGDFFAPDLRDLLERGFADDLAATLAELPDARALGLDDTLDLLAIRARLPNFAGYAQPRLDGRAVCLTPFVQPSFLRELFRLPPRARSSGHVKRWIRQHAPSLAKEPLVRGSALVPFRVPHLAAPLAARFAQPAVFADTTRRDVLAKLEQLVREHVRSRAVREDSTYDGSRLVRTVDAYYDGDATLGHALDWWLALDVWRRGLRGGDR